jgi:predicted chitinase
MTLTDEMLRLIMPHCPRARRAQCMPHLVQAMLEFEITTELRVAAFLATIAVESAELRFFAEIASGAAYEGRRDLGNVFRGDGRKYKGRGVIQVTGRSNSEACLKFLGLPAGRPELLEQIDHAFRSAGWFWETRSLNPLADQRKFLAVQIRVNGRNRRTGLPNHWEQRRAYYERALRVLPDGFVLTADNLPELEEESRANADHVDDSASDIFDAVLPTEEVAEETGAPMTTLPEAGVAGLAFEGAALAAVDGGGRRDLPVAVEAAAPAKERTTKSLVSTLTAGISSIGLTIGTAATMGANWLKEHPEVVVLFAVCLVVFIVCYIMYQHRQTRLDLADRAHARDVTLETMRIRSDPQLINVEVRPRAVPPDPETVRR